MVSEVSEVAIYVRFCLALVRRRRGVVERVKRGRHRARTLCGATQKQPAPPVPRPSSLLLG
jgi:hypothetical protein